MLFNSCNCKPTESWRTTVQPGIGLSENEGDSPPQSSWEFLCDALFPFVRAASFWSAYGKKSCSLRFVFSLLELFFFQHLQELLNTDKNWICSKSYGTYYGEKSRFFSQFVPTRPSSNGRRNQGWERWWERPALIICWGNTLNILLQFRFFLGGGGRYDKILNTGRSLIEWIWWT
jgi:hypothetical protein